MEWQRVLVAVVGVLDQAALVGPVGLDTKDHLKPFGSDQRG